MPIVDNLLLRTGRGNPSPAYIPELPRFDGWPRQSPTVTRGVPRGRPMDHPAHTPAVPLPDRALPNLTQAGVPQVPQIITFWLNVKATGTTLGTSGPIATPAIITHVQFSGNLVVNALSVQAGLVNSAPNTAAQLALAPKIFTWAPDAAAVAQPLTLLQNTLQTHDLTIPLGYYMPNGPRNRICINVAGTSESEDWLGVIFRIAPVGKITSETY